MPNYSPNMRNYNRCQPHAPTPPVAIPCTCSHNDVLEGLALAMAYVQWQEWSVTYDLNKGLQRGTIWKDLDKPFTGKGDCRS